jgi:hypothetical protein
MQNRTANQSFRAHRLLVVLRSMVDGRVAGSFRSDGMVRGSVHHVHAADPPY